MVVPCEAECCPVGPSGSTPRSFLGDVERRFPQRPVLPLPAASLAAASGQWPGASAQVLQLVRAVGTAGRKTRF